MQWKKPYDHIHNCYDLLDLCSAQKFDHFLEILVHFNDSFEAHWCVLEHGVVVFVNFDLIIAEKQTEPWDPACLENGRKSRQPKGAVGRGKLDEKIHFLHLVLHLRKNINLVRQGVSGICSGSMYNILQGISVEAVR